MGKLLRSLVIVLCGVALVAAPSESAADAVTVRCTHHVTVPSLRDECGALLSARADGLAVLDMCGREYGRYYDAFRRCMTDMAAR